MGNSISRPIDLCAAGLIGRRGIRVDPEITTARRAAKPKCLEVNTHASPTRLLVLSFTKCKEGG
jgi:hypothetical protein